ncbi:MAG TPA: hypothetical protein VGX75_17715, partial [bacterium]|nr:hypothetical protein [bacterium]
GPARKAPPRSAPPAAPARPRAAESAPAPAAVLEPGSAAGLSVSPGAPLTIDGLRVRWPAVMDDVKQRTRAVHAYLLESAPRDVAGDEIVLGVRHPFHLERLEEPKNRVVVAEALARVFGAAFRPRFMLDETATDVLAPETPAPGEGALVDEAVRRFGNPVQEVRRLE